MCAAPGIVRGQSWGRTGAQDDDLPSEGELDDFEGVGDDCGEG